MSAVIREVKDASDFAICMAIRMEVFVREQGVPLDEEMDDHDATATHYVMQLDGAPVAVARTRILEDGTAKIERVAIRAQHRGMGLGRQLMQHLIARLRNHPKTKTIRISAQAQALEFYEKLGFTLQGEGHMEAGIPHFTMELSH